MTPLINRYQQQACHGVMAARQAEWRMAKRRAEKKGEEAKWQEGESKRGAHKAAAWQRRKSNCDNHKHQTRVGMAPCK